MRKRCFIAVIIFLAFGCAQDQEPPESKDVYAYCPKDATALMMGQSNVIGFDGVCEMAVFAVGGTSITEWLPERNLFRPAIECGGASVETIYWFQGETDAMPRYSWVDYGKHLNTLLTAIEGEMNPEVEIVLIHTITGYPRDSVIYDAKEASGFRTIETFDLEREEDNCHLSWDGKIQLCERL